MGPSDEVVASLADRIEALPPRLPRLCIAVAGPPGAGKSMLAAALVTHLNRAGQVAALVPMDGFHLDNAVLAVRGLLSRKGAPETFDAGGFVHMVGRISREAEVVVPVFDRARDIALAGASVVGRRHRFAVVEGNYLLLDSPPWNALRWDLSIFLKPPQEELRRRLVARWLDHGLDPEAARARAEGNDLPNAELVLAQSRAADLTL